MIATFMAKQVCSAPGSRCISRVHKARRGSRSARPSGFPTEPPPGSHANRCRGHDATDGDPAIGRVDVQLVPDPGGGDGGAWPLRLKPTAQAKLGRSASICGEAHRQLPFQPAWLLMSLSACGACPRLRRRLQAAFASAPPSRLNRTSIHRREMCSTRCRRRSVSGGRRLEPRRLSGKLGKGPGKPSPRSEAGLERHRSSRLTAAIACRQPARRSISAARRRNARTPPSL